MQPQETQAVWLWFCLHKYDTNSSLDISNSTQRIEMWQRRNPTQLNTRVHRTHGHQCSWFAIDGENLRQFKREELSHCPATVPLYVIYREPFKGYRDVSWLHLAIQL